MKQLGAFTLYLIYVLCQGCGSGAKARIQPIDIISSPPSPSMEEGVYSLNPQASGIGYGGTLVFMDKNISPSDLADLLQASIDSRIAWGTARKFAQESNFALKYAEGGIYEAALRDMKLALKQFESNAKAQIEMPQEILDNTAETWLSDELDNLYPNDSQARSAAKLVFDRYCEAKIWELATNSFFALGYYEAYPSPMPFCKKYYRTHGFFRGDSCDEAASGKNYFSCIWQHGVKLTSFYSEYPEDQKRDIDALLEEGSIEAVRDIIGIYEPAFTFKSPLYKSRTIGQNKENRDYFSKIILNQSKGSLLCERVIPNYSKLCSVFEKVAVSSQDPLSLTPADTISAVEGTNAEQSSLFPLPQRQNTPASTKEILAYLGMRQKHQNSELDRLFHKVTEGLSLIKPNLNESLAAKGFWIEEMLSGRLYPTLEGVDRERVATRMAQIESLEADYHLKNQLYTQFNQSISNSSDQAFKIANRPSVARAFMEIRLKISNRNGILRAYHWLKDYEHHAVLACLNTITLEELDETCLPHPDDNLEAEVFQPAKMFRINRDTGLIELELDLFDPVPLGYKKKVRVSGSGDVVDSFSDIDSSEFYGKSLYFELYPNRVFDHLEILTGKAFLRDGSEDLQEAAISLWDQNL